MSCNLEFLSFGICTWYSTTLKINTMLAMCTNRGKPYIDSTMATNLTQRKWKKIHKLLLITDIKMYVYLLYRFRVPSCTIGEVWIWHILCKYDWQSIDTVFVLECIFQSVSKISCFSFNMNPMFNEYFNIHSFDEQLCRSIIHMEYLYRDI